MIVIISYKRINFLNDFKNSGYVKKILCLYKDTSSGYEDCVYYNDRDRTEVPCINGEVLIINDYENNINIYKLVKTDFTINTNYKIIMTTINSKKEIYKFIEDNLLVEIRLKPLNKKPQIDSGYGEIIFEVFKELQNKDFIYQTNKFYKEEIYNIVISNLKLSRLLLDDNVEERIMCIRVKSRLANYLDIIFKNHENDEISINQILKCMKEYKENYYYNI